MKSKRLFWKIFPAFTLIAFLSIVFVVLFSYWSLRVFYFQKISEDFESQVSLFFEDIRFFLKNGNKQETLKILQKLGNQIDSEVYIVLSDRTIYGLKDKPYQSINKLFFDQVLSHPEIVFALEDSKKLNKNYFLVDNWFFYFYPIKEKKRIRSLIVVAKDVNHIKNKLWGIYSEIFFAGLFLFILTIVISWLMSRNLSRPLDKMKNQARAIAEGDFSTRLQISKSAPRELHHLAESIERISVELAHRFDVISNQKIEQSIVFSSLIEGILAVDLDRSVRFINQSAAELFRISRFKAKGKSVIEVVRVLEIQQFIFEVEKQLVPMEKEFDLFNPEETVLHVKATPLRTFGQEIIGNVFVFSDVTRLRKLEVHRKQFVDNVSHELRTPLTSIRGYLETILTQDISDLATMRRFLKVVENQTVRLTDLVEDLLSLSKLEDGTGNIQLDMKKEFIGKIILSAVNFCAVNSFQKNIEIINRVSDEVTLFVNFGLMEQAFINLLSNAIKYNDGNSKIYIEQKIDNSRIHISVRDQGIGISKKNLERIFERFFRVDKARSKKEGGTGLGLAIVKHIVHCHKGEIFAESELGVGSCFTISLPFTVSPANEIENSIEN